MNFAPLNCGASGECPPTTPLKLIKYLKDKVFKSYFVDGKRSRGRSKNLWKETVDKDSIALGIEPVLCDI